MTRDCGLGDMMGRNLSISSITSQTGSRIIHDPCPSLKSCQLIIRRLGDTISFFESRNSQLSRPWTQTHINRASSPSLKGKPLKPKSTPGPRIAYGSTTVIACCWRQLILKLLCLVDTANRRILFFKRDPVSLQQLMFLCSRFFGCPGWVSTGQVSCMARSRVAG